ncbi:hypothetical protein GGI07_003907 [Coemansia sp. Benny D115]|nr:hypothetical protein GGI07_003907 [Coemansia sp. Benny D115]
MATISAPSAVSAGPTRSSSMARCRQWLHSRRSMQRTTTSGCPELYNTPLALPSPTVVAECQPQIMLGGGFTLGRHARIAGGRASAAGASSTASLHSADMTEVARAMHVRSAADDHLRRRITADPGDLTSVATSQGGGAVPVDNNCGIASEDLGHEYVPLSPVSMPATPVSPPTLQGWECLCSECYGSPSETYAVPQEPFPPVQEDYIPREVLTTHATFARQDAYAATESFVSPEELPSPEFIDILPHRTSSVAFHDDDLRRRYMHVLRRHHPTMTVEEMSSESEYAEYSHSTMGRRHSVDAAVAIATPPVTPTALDTPTQNGGIPSAAAIAHIFLVGQPAVQVERPFLGLSRARRASRRLGGMLAQKLWFNSSSGTSPPQSFRACAEALGDVIAADGALAASIRVLSRTRGAVGSAAFRARADRVHEAQGRVLQGVYALFAHGVPADARRSRHYRFYLPEDDQAELDRGFSESVLFAAQALARGYQIRGTELHTQRLREPARLLCAAWAALRHVLHMRADALERVWNGNSDPEALDALRGVLEDFDAAWVRFERDLCFAYFGLGTSALPPTDADVETRAAQEDEFSLLVVLLSETLQRSMRDRLVVSEQLEDMDPQLILALPRLAILHAIARGGVEGLCFVAPETSSDGQTDSAPVFWWFREYSLQCQRIHHTLSQWPGRLVDVIQNLLVAEEADVALAAAEPMLLQMLQTLEVKQPPAPPVDIESILDVPRATRSLSIDCSISSVCQPSSVDFVESVCKNAFVRRVHAKSLSEALDPRLDLIGAAKEAERRAKLEACKSAARMIYVDICTVADSLHSGPFARPFRVALEMVFRMNSDDN